VLAWNVLDRATETGMDQWVVSGTTATVRTTAAHSRSVGDWVLVENAPGARGRFNGVRQIASVPDSTHFTYSIDTTTFPTSAGTYTLPTATAASDAHPTATLWRVLVPGSSFTLDNPATWTAPGAGNAATGQTLWNTKTLRTKSPHTNFADSNSTCGSCHFRNGADLKILNYSANALKIAAVDRGYTDTESDHLIAYVFGLSDSRTIKGRPWNPPFQPGPGLDSGTPDDWIAGAGLDWQLTYDDDMREYMEPERTAGRTAATSYIKRREIPIPVQFQHWNKWLPAYNPAEIWSDWIVPASYPNPPIGTPDWYDYYANTVVPSSSGVTAFNSTDSGWQYFGYKHIMWRVVHNIGDWDRFGQTYQSGSFLPQTRSGSWANPVYETALHGQGLLRGIKGLEQLREKALIDQAGAIYISKGHPNSSHTETRGVYGKMAFDSAAHKLHLNQVGFRHGYTYTSMAWYQVQFTQDCGQGLTANEYPIDWGYLPAFLRSSGFDFRPLGWMQLESAIGAGQCVSDHTDFASWLNGLAACCSIRGLT
jgi:hypothetical protein